MTEWQWARVFKKKKKGIRRSKVLHDLVCFKIKNLLLENPASGPFLLSCHKQNKTACLEAGRVEVTVIQLKRTKRTNVQELFEPSRLGVTVFDILCYRHLSASIEMYWGLIPSLRKHIHAVVLWIVKVYFIGRLGRRRVWTLGRNSSDPGKGLWRPEVSPYSLIL